MYRKLYFAGDLFDYKHLVGNALLASAIEKKSNNNIKVLLPQNHEQSNHRATQIRNQDLAMVLESDLALFNFDGTDLDSGTVVEFMFAKFLDIPSVILRSDFRNGGDGLKDGDPWNLMATGYPRTSTLIINSMAEYQKQVPNNLNTGIESFIDSIADKIIDSFTVTIGNRMSPLTYAKFKDIKSKYLNAIDSAGESLKIFLKNKWNTDDSIFENVVENLINGKINRGIY